jgi:hypothetical protein
VKAPRETELVRQCLALLGLRGVFAWRNNSGAFVRDQGEARRYFRAGAVGSPDILGVLPGGRFLGVECKRPAKWTVSEAIAHLTELRDRLRKRLHRDPLLMMPDGRPAAWFRASPDGDKVYVCDDEPEQPTELDDC